jgi:penicillin-binding protein 1B
VETATLTPLEVENTTPEALPKRPRPNRQRRYLRYALLGLAAAAALGATFITVFYVKYARLTDQRLKAGPFSSTAAIYAAPKIVRVGEPMRVDDLSAILHRAGADQNANNPGGWFRTTADSVEFHPPAESGEAAIIRVNLGKIAQIESVSGHRPLKQYVLPPQLITGLSEKNREKRRLVKFRDIPPDLVHAIVSAEDKRFFQHPGFDAMRILKAAWVDFRNRRKDQGASTLTMQLARNFWLDADKSWRRKFAEVLIALRLEERLTKEQIFEDYCNQVYLGRLGTYSINGFGAASEAFFGKDIRLLTLPETATLAGLMQRPSYFSPLRNPDRAVERRNLVLGLMRQNEYVSEAQYASAIDIPLVVQPDGSDSTDAPYFVDLLNDELGEIQETHGSQSSVYTTLDLDLQRAAAEAVQTGMEKVDALLRRSRRSKSGTMQAQVALIAIDPHTGDVKAMVGGRDYLASQLNRALAMRQPGSVFKPFVYAAALNTAIEGGRGIFTPATTIEDQPTTFLFDHRQYTPGNFHNAYYGQVTFRRALAHSMNNAAIKVAEMVGYDAVVRIARRAGLNDAIRPTPSVALGAYETTPLEMAGAYTVFANQGVYVKPRLISTVSSRDGVEIYRHQPETRVALDPRVAYLMVNLLEDVMRSGTAAGVRGRGFKAPAAGKTGTSRDGWFAGFTSNLLCIVWVGFDDNRELGLEGAKSALPIWTEFMKRAVNYYPGVTPFSRPSGVIGVEICPESGLRAGAFCDSRTEVFIAGTEPETDCILHADVMQQTSEGTAPGQTIALPQYSPPALSQ